MQRQVTILLGDDFFFERVKVILTFEIPQEHLFGLHSNAKGSISIPDKRMSRINRLKKESKINFSSSTEIKNHKGTNAHILLIINGRVWEVDAREESGILGSSIFFAAIQLYGLRQVILLFLGLNFLDCKMKLLVQ